MPHFWQHACYVHSPRLTRRSSRAERETSEDPRGGQRGRDPDEKYSCAPAAVLTRYRRLQLLRLVTLLESPRDVGRRPFRSTDTCVLVDMLPAPASTNRPAGTQQAERQKVERRKSALDEKVAHAPRHPVRQLAKHRPALGRHLNAIKRDGAE